MIRYFRIKLFYILKGLIAPYARRNRMREFTKLLQPFPGARIVDLGGTPHIWQFVDVPVNVTIVNFPDQVLEQVVSHHTFSFVDGDATSLPQFANNSFDIAFSNSVIEHVGGPAKEAEFAQELRRLAPNYWMQTPSIWFPLEAHTGIPFWWAMPKCFRARLHKRWERILPAWNEMIAGTVVIKKSALRRYFPDGTMKTETMLGMPKSYCVYRIAAQPEPR